MQVNANETTYQDVKDIMTNAIEEFFHKIEVRKGTNNHIIIVFLGLVDPQEGIVREPVEHLQPHLQAGPLRLHLPSGKGEEHHHHQPL